MPLIPLTYESTKTVLMYMEANKRFQISRRIPSLRKVERFVPLTIDVLDVGITGVTINKKTYRIGLCQNYDGDTPEIEKKNNNEGGVFVDQDEYGCVIPHREDEIASDERIAIVLRKPEDVPQALSSDKMIAQLRKQGVDANSSSYEVMERRQQLIAHGRKRGRVSAPFEHYVQLKVTRRYDDKEWIEKLAYSKKLFEYTAYLTDFFFKNRKESVKVRKLHMNKQFVFQLPIDIRFKIQSFTSWEPATRWVLNALNPVIDPTSFPLRHLCVRMYYIFAETFDHPHVKSARKLKICDLRRSVKLEDFQTLRNPYIQIFNQLFTSTQFAQLVENWLRERREVGTQHEFQFRFKKDITELFKVVADLNPNALVRRESITIPVNNMKELLINYTRKDGYFIVKMEMIGLH